MTEDWFDKDEFQKFYEDLTSEKEKLDIRERKGL